MDKPIEAILELIPFSSWFERLGFSQETSAGLYVVTVAILVWILASTIKKLNDRWKNSQTAKTYTPNLTIRPLNKQQIFIPPPIGGAAGILLEHV